MHLNAGKSACGSSCSSMNVPVNQHLAMHLPCLHPYCHNWGAAVALPQTASLTKACCVACYAVPTCCVHALVYHRGWGGVRSSSCFWMRWTPVLYKGLDYVCVCPSLLWVSIGITSSTNLGLALAQYFCWLPSFVDFFEAHPTLLPW